MHGFNASYRVIGSNEADIGREIDRSAHAYDEDGEMFASGNENGTREKGLAVFKFV